MARIYNDPYGAVRLPASGKSTPVRHNGPHTFDTKLDAESWLLDERRLISNGTWTPPAERKLVRKRAAESGAMKFGRYADDWLSNRTVRTSYATESCPANPNSSATGAAP